MTRRPWLRHKDSDRNIHTDRTLYGTACNVWKAIKYDHKGVKHVIWFLSSITYMSTLRRKDEY